MPEPIRDHSQEMIHAHPRGAAFDDVALLACLRACLDCAAACNACADACSAEDDPKRLVRCIRLNHDCADLCTTTARILGRQAEPSIELIRAVVDVCARACVTCAEECERHAAHMAHCRICAEACRGCADACRRLSQRKAQA